jgi:hypothetical protein
VRLRGLIFLWNIQVICRGKHKCSSLPTDKCVNMGVEDGKKIIYHLSALGDLKIPAMSVMFPHPFFPPSFPMIFEKACKVDEN